MRLGCSDLKGLRGHAERMVNCPAVAQRPVGKWSLASIRPDPARHKGADEVSTSAPSLAAAEFGTKITLQRLERSLEQNKLGGSASDFVWLPDVSMMASATEEKPTPTRTKAEEDKKSDYFANVGDAIRTLRDDIPSLFERDLNCEQQWPSSACAHAVLTCCSLVQTRFTGRTSCSGTPGTVSKA